MNNRGFSAIFGEMRSVFLFLLIALSARLNAQSDSVLYTQGFDFRQGVYLTYEQFRSNSPIPKSAIIFEADTARFDYLKQALSKESFQWKDSSGIIQTTKTTSVWGYSENKTVYVRWNYAFNRVMVIGTICHFTATVTNYMYTGPGTYPNQQYGTPVESLQQYVIDTKTGGIYEFNPSTMSTILHRDPVLFAEYDALKKKQKKDQAFVYLRKYNEKHPFYFPR